MIKTENLKDLKKLYLYLFLVLMVCSTAISEENMILNCKEVGKDKIYTYSIDNKFISFGLYKYTIKDINEIKIRAERDNLKNEYGFIIVDRVKGTIEHVHGLGGKSESVMKANVIFALNLECKKVESKF